MDAYIELITVIPNDVVLFQHELTSDEIREIGKFTRSNVLKWMQSQRGIEWVDKLPIQDFHAVCGDIDIPWATEKARREWERIYPAV
jgi:hypothetical protein